MRYTPDHIHQLEDMLCRENEVVLNALQAAFHDRFHRPERLDHYIKCIEGQLFPPIDYPLPEKWELVPKESNQPQYQFDIYQLMSNPLILIGVVIVLILLSWVMG